MNHLTLRALTKDRQPRTGKFWKEWYDLLDAWGGETKDVVTIETYLISHYQLHRLLAHTIAVYYKREWRSAQQNAIAR